MLRLTLGRGRPDMHEVFSSARARGAIYSEGRRRTHVGTVDGLSFVAAPTFAVMALLTAVGGAGPDMLCSAAGRAWPFGGMVPMYLLMAVFHARPWLKLLAAWRSGFAAKAVSEESDERLYG
jgi:hypothetical protein